jgi:hypothetical protein
VDRIVVDFYRGEGQKISKKPLTKRPATMPTTNPFIAELGPTAVSTPTLAAVAIHNPQADRAIERTDSA